MHSIHLALCTAYTHLHSYRRRRNNKLELLHSSAFSSRSLPLIPQCCHHLILCALPLIVCVWNKSSSYFSFIFALFEHNIYYYYHTDNSLYFKLHLLDSCAHHWIEQLLYRLCVCMLCIVEAHRVFTLFYIASRISQHCLSLWQYTFDFNSFRVIYSQRFFLLSFHCAILLLFIGVSFDFCFV